MFKISDLPYALQQNPSLVVVVLLLLAFGIGANTTIFSVVEAALLRPLPYRVPGRSGDWREQNHSFEEMRSGRKCDRSFLAFPTSKSRPSSSALRRWRLRRFETELLSIFAGLAVVLAIMGIYGLLHYAVTHRTCEVGIRIALGAQRAHFVRVILRQGLVRRVYVD